MTDETEKLNERRWNKAGEKTKPDLMLRHEHPLFYPLHDRVSEYAGTAGYPDAVAELFNLYEQEGWMTDEGRKQSAFTLANLRSVARNR